VKRAYTRAIRDAPRDLTHGWPRQRKDRGGRRRGSGIVEIVGNSFIVAHATDKFARSSRYCRGATSAKTGLDYIDIGPRVTCARAQDEEGNFIKRGTIGTHVILPAV